MSFKNSFKLYKEVDLVLERVEIVNKDSVVKYFSSLLRGYKTEVTDSLKFLSPNYQQAELYHIAIFTSVRDEEKLQYIQATNEEAGKLLESTRERWRLYRNYLAHYNCCEASSWKWGDQIVTLGQAER